MQKHSNKEFSPLPNNLISNNDVWAANIRIDPVRLIQSALKHRNWLLFIYFLEKKFAIGFAKTIVLHIKPYSPLNTSWR